MVGLLSDEDAGEPTGRGYVRSGSVLFSVFGYSYGAFQVDDSAAG